MHILLTLALKDLVLLLRDRFGLFWIVAFPIMFALFFGTVFGGSGSPGAGALSIGVVDEDDSDAARALQERLAKSEALKVEKLSLDDARERVRKGALVAFVVIPQGFGKTALFGGDSGPGIQLGIDPARRAEAGYLQGMLTEAVFAGLQDSFADPVKAQQQIKQTLLQVEQAKDMPPEQRQNLQRFFGELEQFLGKMDAQALRQRGPMQSFKIETVQVSPEEVGPRSAFEITFPSAILWAIMGCVTSFAISIVTERRAGTLLRLRIAPISWTQLLAGKALACFLACAGVTTLLLILARVVFGVRVESPLLLLLGIVSMALCFVGIMMLLSTLGKTEQGVAGAGWGILMPLAMLGGGMIPLIAMPNWMRTASSFSPVKWGILALEGAIWRGFTLTEMLLPCAILLVVGGVCFAAGVKLLSRAEA